MNTTPPSFSFAPTVPPSSHTSFSIHVNPNDFHPRDNVSLINSVNNSWFVNLSKIVIPQEVQSLLQLGDKFCLRSHHNSQRFIFDFIKSVESNIFRTDPDTANNIRCLAIQTLNECLSSPLSFSHIDSRLSSLTKITKKFLFDHPDIVVTKADKGNVTVSLNRTDYLNKMHDLLSDRETFCPF